MKIKLTDTITTATDKEASKFKKLEASPSISLEEKTLEPIFTTPTDNQLKFLHLGETSTSTKLTSLLPHGLANMDFPSSTLPLKEET